MKPYPLSAAGQGLRELPPFSDRPGYEVLEGDPVASIRIDHGTDSTPTLGIWHCTPGTFRCIEQGDELQTVLAGRLVLTGEDGVEHTLIPGDSVFTRKGERVTWRIEETVTKVFFTHDPDA